MRLAILYGGKSGEHEVSLRSAASVIRHLDKSHRLHLIGITKAGSWHLQPDSVLATCLEGDEPMDLRADGPEVLVVPGKGLRVYGTHGSADLPLDAVFPVLHGTFGEDGTVQGLLECANLAYVGADVLGSAIGMDKEMTKALWRQAGLPIVPSITARASDLGRIDDLAANAEGLFGWPMFVKPVTCGSSVGASKAETLSGLKSALSAALEYDTRALIEPFVAAREIECAVLGNDDPRAFPPGEIIPSHEFYDYDAKYIDPDGARLVVPAPLDEATTGRVKDIAVAAYKAAGLSGMARVDFFVDKNDGTVYLNEANTIPGFTSISMYPMMCEAGGLPYSALLDELVSLAVDRKKTRAAVRYDRA
ncbi:MAG: D-alanine--D-alanine ligase A [Spirochaetae bacterium HGW-Spirochaetae-3]|jgi:D-alanine-D-alanine ligase|nr:MAG: D-alanine--D-alanine ligase A [Spirochaetae bacterium HGW-Spirochaetae-3]